MPHNTQYHKSDDIIESRIMGEIQAKEIYEIFQTDVTLALKYDCFHWLNDYREASLKFSLFDIYNYIEALDEATLILARNKLRLKKAIVDSRVLDMHRLAESVAQTNHHALRNFTDYYEAVAWLQSDTISDPVIPATLPKRELITVQVSVNRTASQAWLYWIAEEYINKWFHTADGWHTAVVVNDVCDGGKFNYRIASNDGLYGYNFSGQYRMILREKMIEFQIADGRIGKVLFQPMDGKTIITETVEADINTPLGIQGKILQSVLEYFKKTIENN